MALTAQEIETLLDVLSREDHNEKRRQERKDVTLKGVAPAHGMEDVHVIQLSAKGVRFKTDVLLEEKEMFRVLVEETPMAMTLVLNVLRRDDGDAAPYTYGAEILELIR
jgi:hypothetical protein